MMQAKRYVWLELSCLFFMFDVIFVGVYNHQFSFGSSNFLVPSKECKTLTDFRFFHSPQQYLDVPGSGQNETHKKLQGNESKAYNNDCRSKHWSNRY